MKNPKEYKGLSSAGQLLATILIDNVSNLILISLSYAYILIQVFGGFENLCIAHEILVVVASASKAQTSLCIHSVSPEPLLLANTLWGS